MLSSHNSHFREHNWTPREDAIVRDGWQGGDSLNSIAVRVGVSRLTVINRAHRLGLPDKPAPSQRVGHALPATDLSNAFYQAAPERRARGYDALRAGDPISWGAIAGHVTVMA